VKNAEKQQSKTNKETYKTNVTKPKTKDELQTGAVSSKEGENRYSNRY